jgi:structural maintenance of chromosome 4
MKRTRCLCGWNFVSWKILTWWILFLELVQRENDNQIWQTCSNWPFHQDVKFIRVEICLKYFDDIQEVPNSTFSVSRQVERSGECNYYLNSSKISKKDLISTLSNYGIDFENNRFLILQGQVETISQLKPIGTSPNQVVLLEFLQ